MPDKNRRCHLDLDWFIQPRDLALLVSMAFREDLGPNLIDLTSAALVPADHRGQAVVRARRAGRLAGGALLATILRVFDQQNPEGHPPLSSRLEIIDGNDVNAAAVVATVTGPMRSILAAERVALNFITHLSGIATLTARYVDAVQGTCAAICDTRKTHPALRGIEKYAVACGGGLTHRMGLYDAVLAKDNHLAGIAPSELNDVIAVAVGQWRGRDPAPDFIAVEVETLEQFRTVLRCNVDIVLLDNMTIDQLREAVALRDAMAINMLLEATGEVALQTVRAVAETGVDRISVGSITHSAPTLDIALDVEDRPSSNDHQPSTGSPGVARS